MSDISKLPKWAQEEIAGRDREIARLNATLAAYRQDANPDESNTFVEGWTVHSDDDIPLGLNTGVRFILPSKFPNSRGASVRVRNGQLNVQGSGALIMRATASNNFLFELDES